MKKLKVAVAAFIALMAVATTACSGNDKNAVKAADDSTAQAQRVAPGPGEGFEPTTNIRYYIVDSIANGYELLKELEVTNRQMMTQYQQTLNAREAELNRLIQDAQHKQQTGAYLSQASADADARNIQQKGQAFQQLQISINDKINLLQLQQQQQFLDSIYSYLVEYNKDHHYDAILPKGDGMYFNPAMDITADILKGMNERYQSKNAPAKAEKAAPAAPAVPAAQPVPATK